MWFLRHWFRSGRPPGNGFMRRDYGRWTWIVRTCVGNPSFDGILKGPDEALASRADIIKRSDSTTIARIEGYVVKKWASHGMGGYLKDRLRRTRAERAALHALQLIEARIPTAEPLAWGACSGWRSGACSVLIMEELRGVVDLGRWKGERLPVVGRFGHLIGALHQQGFTHRDLKPTNLLVATDGSPYLIDLDGLGCPGLVSPARAVADLVKLARRMVELSTLSPREAVEFVTRYASARGAPRRRWWESIKAGALLHHEFSPRLRERR